MRDAILIVDDIAANRILLREILLESYDVLDAESGEEALDILFRARRLPQVILLDTVMPGLDGYDVLEKIKADPRVEWIPVLFISSVDAHENESRALRLGAADYIYKPFSPDLIKARVATQIQLMRYRTDLEQVVQDKLATMTRTHEAFLERLATVVERRSKQSTGLHVSRCRALAGALLDRMLETEFYADCVPDMNRRALLKALPLHDIGKVGIPDGILLKGDALTAEEFEIIQTHTVIGAEIIDTLPADAGEDEVYLHYCRDICLNHHEHWDGRGYPNGRAGEDIPLSARIMAVVDVYDALVSELCYKPAIAHIQAVKTLKEGAGTQFDPGLIALIDDVQTKFQQIELEMADPEASPR